jgi:hypothetical protein
LLTFETGCLTIRVGQRTKCGHLPTKSRTTGLCDSSATNARPDPKTLKALTEGCDPLILPCTATNRDPVPMDELTMTIEALDQNGVLQ